MERYYTRIDQKYAELEAQLESMMYEFELLSTFGPAMEADATVAAPGKTSNNGTGDTSSDADTDNKAVNSLGTAENNMGKNEQSNQKQDADKTNAQSIGKDNEKAKSNLSQYINEILEKIREFIRKAIVEFRSSMSDMLDEHNDTVKELNKIMAGKTPNLNFSFKDYVYNDEFLGEFGKALSKASSDYFAQIDTFMTKLNKLKDAMGTGDKDQIEQAITEFGIMDSKKFNELPEEEKVKMGSNVKIKTPAMIIAEAIGFKSNTEVTNAELKKYLYNKFKGVDDNNKEPKVMNLNNNQRMLQQAVDYIKNRYRDYLKIANDSVDNLRKDSEAYERLCDRITSLKYVDERIRDVITSAVNAIARDISSISALMEYYRTMVKERGLSAEALIKGAYGAKPVSKAKNDGKKYDNEGNEIVGENNGKSAKNDNTQSNKSEVAKSKNGRRSSDFINEEMQNEYNKMLKDKNNLSAKDILSDKGYRQRSIDVFGVDPRKYVDNKGNFDHDAYERDVLGSTIGARGYRRKKNRVKR